ncbi:CRISPR-associated exonuclease Cas4 [Desulfonatronum zhilinae]|nr:CRISPR-associated exonuclease Cas4 [Desulfonatronum zhilinae]
MLMTPEHIETGLNQSQIIQTETTLGNRASYIGASDIGNCPRKAVLGKIIPKKTNLRSLLLMKRGHLAEQIVLEALADFDPTHQAELSLYVEYCPTCLWFDPFEPTTKQTCPRCSEPLDVLPLKAHLDILLPGQRILEIKTSALTEIPTAWERQLAMQMFLLSRSTNRNGIDGAIVVLDLGKGSMIMQNHYTHSPENAYPLLNRAIQIWEGLKDASRSENPEQLGLQCEPSPLCGYCSFLGTCPAYQGPELPEQLQPLLESYQTLTDQEKHIKAQKETTRDNILRLLRPGTYKVRNLRIRLSERSRTTTNLRKVEALLGELGQDISEYQTTGKYPVLEIKAA